MKKNIIAISLMAAGLFTFGNVYADSVEEELAKCDESDYTNVCKIDEDDVVITLKKGLKIAGPIHIQYGKNVTFDLNGNDLIFTGETSTNKDSFIQVSNGTLTIKDSKGEGTVSTQNGATIKTVDNDKKDRKIVTIDKNVTIKTEAEGYPAINLSTSTNTTLDVYGKVISETGVAINVNGKQQTVITAPKIHIHDGATIESTNSMAIYLAGYANTTIDAATINGHTGIGIKSGDLTLNNTTVTANGTGVQGQPKSDGMTDTGAAILVEDNTAYKADNAKQSVKIKINGGTYTSKDNSVFMEYGTVDETNGTALEELSIKDATFESDRSSSELIDLPEKSELKNFISGGKFIGNLGDDFQNYLVAGLEVADDGTIVDPLAPTNPSDPTNPGQTGNQENGNGSNTGDNTIDDSPQTYDGIMSYVTMALTSVGAVALSLKKVLSR